MRTVTKTMRQIYRLFNINLYFTSSKSASWMVSSELPPCDC